MRCSTVNREYGTLSGSFMRPHYTCTTITLAKWYEASPEVSHMSRCRLLLLFTSRIVPSRVYIYIHVYIISLPGEPTLQSRVEQRRDAPLLGVGQPFVIAAREKRRAVSRNARVIGSTGRVIAPTSPVAPDDERRRHMPIDE